MPSRREQAGMPNSAGLQRVVLQTMREIDLPVALAELCEQVADALGLSDEQRAVPSANGRALEYAYLVGWALTALKHAGVVDNATLGFWSLTDTGWHIEFDEVERQRTSARANYQRRRNRQEVLESGDGEEAVSGARDDLSWVDELLQRLHALSSAGFERLSRELLIRAGFVEVEVTQVSRDGGIDGVGTYRPSGLISFRTSFQCKRWKDHPVRAPEVQAFQGAIQGQSDRGIIITTSYFTPDAIRQASRPGALPIDLIHGARLAELLKEHGLGVRTEMVEQVTIDANYFDKFDKVEE